MVTHELATKVLINTLNPQISSDSYHHSHFTDEKTESQRHGLAQNYGAKN